MSPMQKVFDSQHLRHKILTYQVKQKYHDELEIKIKNLLSEQITKTWYKYCNCELCNNKREYNLANYGELLM